MTLHDQIRDDAIRYRTVLHLLSSTRVGLLLGMKIGQRMDQDVGLLRTPDLRVRIRAIFHHTSSPPHISHPWFDSCRR